VGFATAVLGAIPDMVWGLGICRGDTYGADCGSCLALAPEVAFGRCQGVKDVTVFYDRCTLRYSFRDFLTNPDNRQVQDTGSSNTNVTSNTGWFNALVVSLIDQLSEWAAFNTTSRYAVGVMNSDQGFPATNKAVVHRIMGLVQCTPDQSPGACRQCLQALIDEMPTVFNGTVGGRIFAVWCYLRFEVHNFYDGIPMLNLAASPPPPPAPTEHQIGIYIIASRFSENVRNDGKLATGFPEQFLFRIIGKIPSLDYPEKTQVSLQCLKLSGSAREATLSKMPQLVIKLHRSRFSSLIKLHRSRTLSSRIALGYKLLGGTVGEEGAVDCG